MDVNPDRYQNEAALRSGWEIYEEARQQLLRNEYEESSRKFGEVVRRFKIHKAPAAQSYVLNVLAALHGDFGNFEAARAYHQDGLEAARQAGRIPGLEVEHLDGMGVSEGNRGRWQEALVLFEEALALTRRVKTAEMRRKRAEVQQHLANVLLRYAGRIDEAIQLYDEAIPVGPGTPRTVMGAVAVPWRQITHFSL
jgi:tetratricopeptide (TPR) repeat protein